MNLLKKNNYEKARGTWEHIKKYGSENFNLLVIIMVNFC